MTRFAGVKWVEKVCGIELVIQNYRNIVSEEPVAPKKQGQGKADLKLSQDASSLSKSK